MHYYLDEKDYISKNKKVYLNVYYITFDAIVFT